LIKVENFKWHLEAFASELFIYIYIHTHTHTHTHTETYVFVVYLLYTTGQTGLKKYL